MANNVKQVKYSELEQCFFGKAEELCRESKGKRATIKSPEPENIGGRTFMQAYHGHSAISSELCDSIEKLISNTRRKLNEAGAKFEDIDNSIAYLIEKGN